MTSNSDPIRQYSEVSGRPVLTGEWFLLVDDPPAGRLGDPERLNYSFVNVNDLPYRELVRAAQQTHRRIYELKFDKADPPRVVPKHN